jgi:predicted TIM-barrel fold metal-dependent hydrolase
MATQTPTIDSQVHAYERDRPERPWRGFLQGPAEVTGDDMVAAMDAVGVDGALLVSPFTMYRYDASYALEVYAKHPGRFGLIKPLSSVKWLLRRSRNGQDTGVVGAAHAYAPVRRSG